MINLFGQDSVQCSLFEGSFGGVSRPLMRALLLMMCLGGISCRTHLPVVVGQAPTPGLPDYFIDEWFGFTENDNVTYKCMLKAGKTGELVAIYSDGEIDCFEISRWHQATNYVLVIEFQLRPAQRNTLNDVSVIPNQFDPTRMECLLRKGVLFATLYGIGGWKEDIVFRRAKTVEDRLLRLKEYHR